MRPPVPTAQKTNAPLQQRGALNVRSFLGLSCIIVVSAVVFATQVRGHFVPDSGLGLPLAVLIAGFALATRLRIVEQIGASSQLFRAVEVPLIVGMFTEQPSKVVLASILGSIIGAVSDRRAPIAQHVNTIVFGVAEVIAVIAVFVARVDEWQIVRTRTWILLATVVLGVRFVRSVLEIGLIWLSGADISARAAVGSIVLTMLGSISMTSFGIVGVMVATQSRAAVLLVTAVVMVPLLVYRSYVLVRDRLQRVRLLQDFTAGFTKSSERSTTLTDIAERTRQVMRAEHSQVLLEVDGLAISETSGSAGAPLTVAGLMNPEGTQKVPSVGDWLWSAVMTSGRVVRALAGRGPAEAQAYAQVLGARSVMAAPLVHNGECIGMLTVRDRRAGFGQFGVNDADLFATMADHAALVLQGQRLDDQVRSEAAERARAASTDALTGLPNRGALHQRIDAFTAEMTSLSTTVGEAGTAVTTTISVATCGAVLTLDLNRFKDINSALGHETGDALIRGVAERVRAVVPKSATVARLGGDELSILLRDIPSVDSAIAAAEAVQEAVRAELVIGDLTIVTDCAIGIALIPDHGTDHLALMRRADVAMYSAKVHREGAIAVFDPAQEAASSRQSALVRDLRSAIENDHLTVHFQPKALFSDGSVVGVEALVRWQHAELGFVPPDEFIGVAEHAGLIEPLTAVVLAKSLEQCMAWRNMGLAVGVAVNLSARSLRDQKLSARIDAALELAGMPASALTLEITEGEYVHDGPVARRTLAELHALGVTLSIDDFGTGYSSLSYLARLTADEVKIDKSFITNVATDEVSAAIVRAVVELAHQLGLKTVAEGVEDQRTWDRLAELGVDIAQGYFLSRPLPGDKCGMWLWERRRGGVLNLTNSSRLTS